MVPKARFKYKFKMKHAIGIGIIAAVLAISCVISVNLFKPIGESDGDITYLVLAPNAGGTCYAIPRENVGLARYQGTNESLVVQQALNATRDIGGGIVQLQNGIHLFDFTIELFSHETLRGEGDNTILKPTKNITTLILVDGAVDVEISHLFIDNTASGDHHLDNAISVASDDACIVEDVSIAGNPATHNIDTAVELVGTCAIARRVNVTNPAEVGIVIGLGYDCLVQDCNIEVTSSPFSTQINGITSVLSTSCRIDGNYVIGTSGAGIGCGWNSALEISSNVVIECGNDSTGKEYGGIDIRLGFYFRVHDNFVSDSPYDNIHCEEVTNSTFHGDVCVDDGLDGIYCDEDCGSNLFSGEQAGSIYDLGNYESWTNCFADDGITVSGVNSVVLNCWDGTQWYSNP